MEDDNYTQEAHDNREPSAEARALSEYQDGTECRE
jgi:hypothetical protein